MKKAVLLVAALVMICSFAFAAEPKAELKISEFTGDASVTLGMDLGTMSAAFSNTANADIKIELVGAGDKSTTGDNIWGELKIVTDGDPVGIKLKQTKLSDYTANDPATIVPGDPFYGFKVKVDVAKLHIGTIAYVGITSDATKMDFVQIPDTGAAVYYVDPDMYYGQRASGHTDLGKSAGDTILVDPAAAGTGANAAPGLVAGISLPNLVNVDVDLRSFNTWDGGGAPLTAAVASPDTPASQLVNDSDLMNRFGIRAIASLTAITNLTAKAGISTGFGGKDQKFDIAFGGTVSYKLPITDTISLTPKVGVNALLDTSDASNLDSTDMSSAVAGTNEIGFVAQAGALLGWGDKSKLDFWFSPDKDTDWGYYPGIAAGVTVKSKKVIEPTMVDDYKIGLNISAFSGTLIENLTGNAAFEIEDLLVDSATETMVMGAMANVKYDIKMDPMTITPKAGLYYLSITDSTAGALTAEDKTDLYIKLGLDIAKIFPNTTLSFEYDSNDFVGGVSNIPSATQTAYQSPLGMVSTTLKIAF